MKKSIILTGLLILSLLPAQAKKDPAKNFNGITVASLNIRNSIANDGTNSWEFRAEAVINMIQDVAPDVLGLQEATELQNNMLDYFLDNYKYVGVGREDGRHKGEHMSIFYNKKTTSILKWGTFWLSETPDVPSKGWDAECFRTATWALVKDKSTGKKYFVINTHLDHKGAEARANGLSLIIDRIASINPDKLPMVVMGDFNVTPDSPSLAPIRATMLNCRDIAAKTDDNATAHDWGKHYSSIDYIWEKGFSSCIEYQTVTRPYSGHTFISDHYPITAKLIF